MKAILTAVAISVAAFAASSANAAPVLFCNDGPGIDLVNDDCISGQARAYPGGGDGVYSNAGGGDPESAVEQAIQDATGALVDISLYGKSDDDPGLFSFTPSDPATGQSGTWSVLDGTLIKYITIKAANSFALYEISGAGANSGTFTTLGILNNGGQQPNVSHISFWTGPAGGIPEPATWAMMIAGFGLTGAAMRRRKTFTSVTA